MNTFDTGCWECPPELLSCPLWSRDWLPLLAPPSAEWIPQKLFLSPWAPATNLEQVSWSGTSWSHSLGKDGLFLFRLSELLPPRGCPVLWWGSSPFQDLGAMAQEEMFEDWMVAGLWIFQPTGLWWSQSSLKLRRWELVSLLAEGVQGVNWQKTQWEQKAKCWNVNMEEDIAEFWEGRSAEGKGSKWAYRCLHSRTGGEPLGFREVSPAYALSHGSSVGCVPTLWTDEVWRSSSCLYQVLMELVSLLLEKSQENPWKISNAFSTPRSMT